jgi:hypothetical protein
MAKFHSRPSAQYRYEHYDPFPRSQPCSGTEDRTLANDVQVRSILAAGTAA